MILVVPYIQLTKQSPKFSIRAKSFCRVIKTGLGSSPPLIRRPTDDTGAQPIIWAHIIAPKRPFTIISTDFLY